MLTIDRIGPGTPENVEAFAVTHTTASFLWDKSKVSNGLIAYDIYQDGAKVGSSELTKYQTVRTNFTAKGLQPGTIYRFAVAARDKEGRVSPLSAAVEVKTAPAGKVFNVKEYGAAGDGQQKDTAYLQQAIDDCTSGGIVRVPEGIYLTAPLLLKSSMTLLLEQGAVLLGSRQQEEYPVMDSRWEGITFPSYQSLVTAINAHHLVIMGEGTLNGNAGPGPDGKNCWWDKPKAYDPKTEIARPRTLHLVHCDDVLVQGITVKNSPSWTIHPLYSKNLVFTDVTVQNSEGGPNTDGFDPDSVDNLLMVNMVFNVGDDCIAIKSGKDAEARKIGIPSTNITIRNCLMCHGHGGISIGSEMSGGIKDIIVRDCVFDGTDIGVRIKTLRGRGGVIENLTFDSIVMQNIVNDAFNINTDYAMNGTPVRPGPATEETPAIRNLNFNNIKISGAKEASYFKGLDEMPIEGLVFSHIDIETAKGLYVKNVSGVKMHDVNINHGQIFQTDSDIQKLSYTGLLPQPTCFDGKDIAYVLPTGLLPCREGSIVVCFRLLPGQQGGTLCFGRNADKTDIICLTAMENGHLELYRGNKVKGIKLVGSFTPDGGWHRAAVIWKGTQHVLYIDGIDAVEAEIPLRTDGSGHFELLLLGKREKGGYYQGEMQNAAVYNYALSCDQAAGYPIEKLQGPGEVKEQGLYVNELQYCDTSEVFSWVPTFLAGCTYIATSRLQMADGLRLTLDKPSALYVAYDARADKLADWLLDFVPTGQMLKNTANTVFHLYRKNCQAGQVTLGINGQGLAMYTVITAPQVKAPKAGKVTLVDPVAAGVAVQGSYIYIHEAQEAETGTIYQWLIADRPEGPYYPLEGATGKVYTPKITQLGKYLKFSVSPKNSSMIGALILSEGFKVKKYQPSVRIVSPLSGGTLAGRVVVEVAVESEFPIEAVELYSGQDLLAVQPAPDEDGTYRMCLSAGDLPPGPCKLIARAYNRYKGLGCSAPLEVEVLPAKKHIKNPIADFYINKFSKSSNFGDTKLLDVRADSRQLDVWYADSIAYITFDIVEEGYPVAYGILSLYGSFAQRQTGAGYANDGIFIHSDILPSGIFAAYRLKDAGVVYDEKTVCYSTMGQDNIGAKLSETRVFDRKMRYEWDVTAAVNEALALGQKQVTIALWADHDTDGNFLFASSKEQGIDDKGQTQVPLLKLYY